jgi:ketosteroid isomerase-like protein
MLTRQRVDEVLDVYVRAWERQDPDLIVTIFTDDASYHERVLDDPIRTRQGIRTYWERKVVAAQANIECRVLAVYVDGDTAIVEWEAHFDDLVERVRKRMREVAILEFDGQLISSLREYWTSEILGGLIR